MMEGLPADLHYRILQLLDGELDEASIGRLEKELRESRQARQLYIQLSALHSALGDQESSRSSIRRVPIVPIERFLAHQNRRVVANALLAAAAVLMITAVVMWIKMVPPPAPVASFRLAPDSTFTLGHSEWKKAPKGHVLSKGSRLQMTKGVMEASFDSGVKCVIKAPCDLTVLADDRVSITEGMAWFHVPPPAVGFTVELPQLTVTDLGTEFGVSAPAKNSHEVHVLDGRVSVVAGNASNPPVELKAGDARKLGPDGTLIEIAAQTGRFMNTLPQRPSRLISNGDLNTAVGRHGDISGDTAFSLDPMTLRVLANGNDTGIHANEWLWSSLTRGFDYHKSGGKTGEDGAFVEAIITSAFNTFRPRAVAQFARDLKATQGSRSLRMDVLLDDNSRAGDLTLLVELHAWNSEQTGPELSMGGPVANDPTYHVTKLNDATTILSTRIPAKGVNDGSWETIDLGSVDLDEGYDFYAWRIGVVSATINDRFAFDNVRIAY